MISLATRLINWDTWFILNPHQLILKTYILKLNSFRRAKDLIVVLFIFMCRFTESFKLSIGDWNVGTDLESKVGKIKFLCVNVCNELHKEVGCLCYTGVSSSYL